MPAGVSWNTYLKGVAVMLVSMAAGSQTVHLMYKPLECQSYYARPVSVVNVKHTIVYLVLPCQIWAVWVVKDLDELVKKEKEKILREQSGDMNYVMQTEKTEFIKRAHEAKRL